MKSSQLKFLIETIVHETLQLLNEAERGEWWIYPGGSSDFADGDIGDSNHEGFVITYLTRQILEHFGIDMDEAAGYLGSWEENLYMILSEEGRLTDEESDIWHNKGTRGGGPTEIIINKLLEDKIFLDKKQAQEAVYIAYGSTTNDARDYAMKYLGWKRMTTDRYGTNLQTWFLRPNDMEDMRRGVFDAWGDTDEDDENNVNHSITIEVRANNKTFEVPFNVFERAEIKDILTYQKNLPWMRENKKSI